MLKKEEGTLRGILRPGLGLAVDGGGEQGREQSGKYGGCDEEREGAQDTTVGK